MHVRLATRGSALARSQSQWVADALAAQGHEVELVTVVTHGDVSTAPLSALGGVGVFVGAVRAAVLDGRADLAVHSFKDLPTAGAGGLMVAAVPRREDPADVACTGSGMPLEQLASGARVGTGSARRAAQVLALRADLQIVDIRGNVETRLGRATADLDAVVLAAAGLRRLGLAGRITQRLDPATFLPAPAQGALAVECCDGAPPELLAALAALDDRATRLAALAERAVLERLGAGCAAPVGAFAYVDDDQLRLSAAVTTLNGQQQLLESAATPLPAHFTPADAVPQPPATSQRALTLGYEVADRLLARGAGTLVDLTASKPAPPRAQGPLAGKQVLLPLRWRDRLEAQLLEAGAQVTAAQFTDIVPLPGDGLEAALTQRTYDWLVVTSPATVPALVAAGGPPRFCAMQVAAVGPATAQALAGAGFDVTLVAGQQPAALPAGGAALAAAFAPGAGHILAPGAQDASAQPAAGLRAKGWDVTQVPVYRTVPVPLPQGVVDRWRAGGFDAFVVTAGSVARAAVAGAGLPGPPVVAMGQPAATASAAVGLSVASIAARPTPAALAEAVIHAMATP